jgi:hypothetical protein
MELFHPPPILSMSEEEEGVAERSPQLGSSSADRALRMVTALSAEVAALRERLAVLEMVGECKGLIRSDEIEGFRPSDEEARRLQGYRSDLIDRVFRALRVDAGDVEWT